MTTCEVAAQMLRGKESDTAMPVSFMRPPSNILPASNGWWPLPPVYCAGIGALIVANGHCEMFLKRIAFAVSGKPEELARLALGRAKVSTVRASVEKMLKHSPAYLPHSAELLQLLIATRKISDERNAIVHHAWLTFGDKIVLTDELTAREKQKSELIEFSLERIYYLCDAAILLSYRLGAFLTAPTELAESVERMRLQYPLPAWLVEDPCSEGESP